MASRYLPGVFVLFGWLGASEQSLAEHSSIYAMNADGTNVRSVIFREDYPSVGSPDISPDGKKIAFDGWKEGGSTSDAHIFIYDMETESYEDLGPGAMPTWSPDGNYIAYSCYSPSGVYVRSVDGTQTKQIDSGWGIQWSPDGTKLAYTISGSFVIYDLLKDEKRTIQPDPENPFSYIYWNTTWSPDTKKLAFKGRRRTDNSYVVSIVDISEETPELTVCFDAAMYDNDLSWHPNGEKLMLTRRGEKGMKPQLHQFEPVAGAATVPVVGQPQDRANIGGTFSPDGKTFYFVSRK